MTGYAEYTDSDTAVPPHDILAERAVLGAALRGGQAHLAEITAIAAPGDFYRPRHQAVFAAICALSDRGAPHDVVAVRAEVERRGAAEDPRGAGYLLDLGDDLADLAAEAPSPATGAYYARIVAECSRRRAIMAAGTRGRQLARQGSDDIEDLAAQVVEEMERAAFPAERGEEDTFAVGEDSDYWDGLATPLDPSTMVVPPYRDLAEAIPALTPGEITTVAGRTGVGKSVCATDFARHAALRQGHTVLYVSLEMDRTMMLNRIYAAEARVTMETFKRKSFTEAQWADLARARERVARAPLHISTPSACTVSTIRARVRSLERRGQAPALVVVDHIGRLRLASGERVDNRAQEVSRFSWGLKELARDHGVPVLSVCQINRDPEKRADPTPTAADLKDSGSVEEDSGNVIIVHRPDRGRPEDPRAGEVDLVIAKNREGAEKTVVLTHQLHYQRFVDMARG